MKKLLHLIVTAVVCFATSTAFADTAPVDTVLNVDFAQFTEGSPTEPVDFPNYGNGSFASYFSGWTSSKLAKAGGSVLIKDGGYMQTSSQNLSAHNGVSKITVSVRANDSYGGIVKISVGYSSNTSVILEDNEWHEVKVVLDGGTSISRIRVEPNLSASGLLIRYMTVEQSDGFIAAPTAVQPSVADGTSFTAVWSSVRGATNYYLDVYSYNDKNEKVYFLKNEDCGALRTKKVTGLDPNTTYYYVVRASNGTGVSVDSNEIEVVKVIAFLDKPVTTDAVVKDGKATFTWQNVEDADYYLVKLNRYTTLTSDTTINVLTEDFSGVKEGTLGTIEWTYNYKLDNYTKTAGWDGDELGLAEGHMVLTPFGGSTGYLTTPVLDLSDDNGKFDVTYRLAQGAFGTMREGGNAMIYLLSEKGDTIESKQIELKLDFQTYNESFTKGEKGCKISLAYSGDYKIFIDSIAISQFKKAGYVITENFAVANTEDTSYTFDFKANSNEKVGYTVTAVGRTVRNSKITDIQSDPSEEKFIEGTSAVEGIEAASEVSVKALGSGMISVTANEETAVTVYDFSGRLLLSATAAPGVSTFDLSGEKLVIVKAGAKAFRLAL